ncbi:MAG TPA: hypothetical protein VKA60_02945 [Blastocatellia bacterium]|nr:hypothetical protein [Blastocatellia bacterium]
MRRTVRVKTEVWRERVVIRGAAVSFCGQCGRVAEFVTPETAAAMIHTNAREVYRRIEADAIHCIEVGSVAVLVCISSLEIIET